MRSPLLPVACVGMFIVSTLCGQSTPGWWKYIPPDSTSIVGIRWQTAQSTLFAPAILDELQQFLDLDFLQHTEEILIAGPSMLAVVSGSFPLADLRQAASVEGFKNGTIKTAEVWVSPDPKRPSVAFISDSLLLIGGSQEIQAALNTKYRSPLVARGSRYAEEDLWVIASRLPDSLASRFIPIEINATAFEGSVSAWDGLHLVAAIEQASPTRAADLADNLEATLDSHPAMAEGTEITTYRRSVLIRMDLDERHLADSLRRPATVATLAAPVEPVTTPPPAAIRILGLTTGTREIPLGH